MGIRTIPADEAERKMRQHIDAALRDLRGARLAAGLSLRRVAGAIGVSRQLLALWEHGDVLPSLPRLARWGSAVGLDLTLRAHPGGSPLRDAGQLSVMARARPLIGAGWAWSTEVSVNGYPGDRRAFDAVLSNGSGRIGLEVITRLTDAQAQTRAVVLKQEAARLDRLVLVLAETRHNRAALATAGPTLDPAFPMRGRRLLAHLRAGDLPPANAILLV